MESPAWINIVSFTPALGVTCGRKFNESLLLYHCYDEIEAAEWRKSMAVCWKKIYADRRCRNCDFEKAFTKQKKAISRKWFPCKKCS